MKRTLRCRYYVRYVDDIVILSEDREQLLHWRQEIEQFLHARLRLALRAEGQEPAPVRRGIEFVGWTTFWNHRRARGRTLASCEARLGRFMRQRLRPVLSGTGWTLDTEREPGALPALRASLASYSGHLRHGAAYRRWATL